MEAESSSDAAGGLFKLRVKPAAEQSVPMGGLGGLGAGHGFAGTEHGGHLRPDLQMGVKPVEHRWERGDDDGSQIRQAGTGLRVNRDEAHPFVKQVAGSTVAGEHLIHICRALSR